MEALEESLEEEIQEFIRQHPNHPAIRVWKGKPATPPPQSRVTRPVTTSVTPAGRTVVSTRADRAAHLPTEASYRRGQWHYAVQHERPDGRAFVRWMPAVAFTAEQLESGHFRSMRNAHLQSLTTEQAAMVALVHMGEGDS